MKYQRSPTSGCKVLKNIFFKNTLCTCTYIHFNWILGYIINIWYFNLLECAFTFLCPFALHNITNIFRKQNLYIFHIKFKMHLKHIYIRGNGIAKWHKITNVILFFFWGGKVSYGSLSREISTWPKHFWPLNSPLLCSGQKWSKFHPEKKNNPHFLSRPYVNS